MKSSLRRSSWLESGYKISGDVLRGVSLLVFLAAVATALLWVYYPAEVRALDEDLEKRYLDSYEDVLRTADESLESGDVAGGIRLLEAHLGAVDWVKKTDQLVSHKRRVHQRLITEYMKAKRHEDALRLYEALIHLDDRDLTSALKRAALLLEVPERRAQGEEALEQLYRRVPTSPAVGPFLDLSLEKGDLIGALEALYQHNRATLAPSHLGSSRWQVYWSPGRRFSSKRTWKGAPTLLSDGRISIQMRLPKEAGKLSSFRVDFPDHLYVVVSDFSVSFSAEGRHLASAEQSTAYTLRRVESRCGAFIPEGRDSFVSFKLPTGISLSDKIEVDLRAQVSPYMPSALEELIGDGDALESALQELKASQSAVAYEHLASVLEQRRRLRAAC